MAAYTNIHRRKGGRGLRPFLLIPKYIGVAIFLGGLVSVCAVMIVFNNQSASRDDWTGHIETVSMLFRNVVIPGIITAIIFGILLIIEHRGVLLRMRWMQLKLILVLLFLPAVHFFMNMQLQLLPRFILELHRHSSGPTVAMQLLRTGLLITIPLVVSIIILGRLKPRLGQNVAAVVKQKNKDAQT